VSEVTLDAGRGLEVALARLPGPARDQRQTNRQRNAFVRVLSYSALAERKRRQGERAARRDPPPGEARRSQSAEGRPRSDRRECLPPANL